MSPSQSTPNRVDSQKGSPIRRSTFVCRLGGGINAANPSEREPARSLRRVSRFGTGAVGFYGTRVVPGWYQGKSSIVPLEGRLKPMPRLFRMLILLQWASGRASVHASPNISGKRWKSGLARTLALPQEWRAKPPKAISMRHQSALKAC